MCSPVQDPGNLGTLLRTALAFNWVGALTARLSLELLCSGAAKGHQLWPSCSPVALFFPCGPFPPRQVSVILPLSWALGCHVGGFAHPAAS